MDDQKILNMETATEEEPISFMDLQKNLLYSEWRNKKGDPASYECQLDGIHIWHRRLDLSDTTRIYTQVDQALVQLNFNLTQGSSCFVDGQPFAKLAKKHHNLFHFAAASDCYCELEPGQQELFGINLPTDVFLRYCPQVDSGFLPFRQKVEQNTAAVCTPDGLPINTAMQHIIQDMLHYDRSPFLRHVYIKAKVIELLTLQLEQHVECHDVHQNDGLKKEELQRMLQVKQLIEEQYDKEHSLASLARAVGTNDATLKKHFKMAFGCTVFARLTHIRMQRAKEMLGEKNAKILHIANHIGYKHASHFSAAFKKHFGYLPTAFRDYS